MQKINYILDKDNLIVHWVAIPFDANKPFVEIEDGVEIHLGFDKVIDGKFIPNNIAYDEACAKTLERVKNLKLIDQYKALLAETDYQALKYADGALTEEEYAPIRAERESYRAKINELEQLI